MTTTSEISEKYVFDILENYFDNPKNIVEHQINSYNEFIQRDIPRIFSEEPDIVINVKKNQSYIVSFGQTYIPTSCIIEDRKLQTIYPRDARNKNLDYCAPLYVDITERLYEKDEKDVEKCIDTKVYRRIPICRIPVMVGSCACSLSKITYTERIEEGECFKDPGGYFIIKGIERVLIGQVRNAYNEIITGPYKNSTDSKYNYASKIRSMSEQTGHSVQIVCKMGTDKRTIAFTIPYITKSILAGIIFKALGFTEENDIRDFIGLNDNVTEKYILYIIRDSFFIKTRQEALEYIKQFIMHSNPKEKQIKYVEQVLNSELFPHMGVCSNPKEKALYLGHMIKKLLLTYTGIRNEDSKDNCGNKRIETAGILLSELFRTLFKRYVKSLNEQLKKRQDIIFQIQKNTTLSVGLKQSMTSSNWGVPKNTYIRTGVSQVLSRLSYQAFISHLRRIGINVGKSDKNAKLRQIHTSQYGAICPVECFDPNTQILTWEGEIKLAKDITIGDHLIDDKGNKTRVKSICSGKAEMYEVIQENGINYTVTYNHILTLKIKNHGLLEILQNLYDSEYKVTWFDKELFSYKHYITSNKDMAFNFIKNLDDDILDINIQDYINLPEIIKDNLYGFKSTGINWEHVETTISPYNMGITIGNLLNNPQDLSYMNYIPKEYIINSRKTRLNVLAGIIDTLGYKRTINSIKLILLGKNENIICNLLSLIKSLGFTCKIDFIDNFKSELRELEIYGDLNEIPTNTQYSLYFTEQPNNNEYSGNIHSERNYKSTNIYNINVVKKDFNDFCGWQLEGNGRFLLSDYTVVHNTPEGQPVGTVLSLTMCSKITKRIPTVIIQDILEKCDYITFIEELKISEYKLYTKIFLNGNIIGFAKDINKVLKEIKLLRDSDLLDENVSIRYEDIDDEIHILSDEGRIIRPLFTIENGKLRINQNDGNNWDKLNRDRKIMYIDVAENQTVNIAMYPSEIDEEYDFCEIHPSLMLGVCASCIPFSDHNPAPRNCFQAAMGKQSMGIPVSTFNTRADTMLHVLSYPQKPLVTTKMSTFIGLNDMPYGINAIVAILCYSGYNQEDAILMNKSSIERGLFVAYTYKTITGESKKSKNNYNSESIEYPPEEIQRKEWNYSYLDKKTGIINTRVKTFKSDGTVYYPEIKVKKGDVIIGKIITESNKNGEEVKKDYSIVIKNGEEGIVDHVITSKTPGGYTLVKVVIRTERIPEVGDKFAARSAQKGLLGHILSQEDMPFTEEGIVPDIIINTHSLPSQSGSRE